MVVKFGISCPDDIWEQIREAHNRSAYIWQMFRLGQDVSISGEKNFKAVLIEKNKLISDFEYEIRKRDEEIMRLKAYDKKQKETIEVIKEKLKKKQIDEQLMEELRIKQLTVKGIKASGMLADSIR